MKITLVLVITILSACTSPTLLTPDLYEASVQQPASSSDETFLNELYSRLETDNTIPKSGQMAIISLPDNEPTFIFSDENNHVLQFNVFEMPKDSREIKETALLLIEAGVVTAGEQSMALSGVEVVFYLSSGEPWLAIGSAPPWQAEQLILAPLHPDYIERLQQMDVIRPTPKPHPSPQKLS